MTRAPAPKPKRPLLFVVFTDTNYSNGIQNRVLKRRPPTSLREIRRIERFLARGKITTSVTLMAWQEMRPWKPSNK